MVLLSVAAPGTALAGRQEVAVGGRGSHAEMVRTAPSRVSIAWRARSGRTSAAFRLYRTDFDGRHALVAELPVDEGGATYHVEDRAPVTGGAVYVLVVKLGSGEHEVGRLLRLVQSWEPLADVPAAFERFAATSPGIPFLGPESGRASSGRPVVDPGSARPPPDPPVPRPGRVRA